jgi:hypothetical protein
VQFKIIAAPATLTGVWLFILTGLRGSEEDDGKDLEKFK